MKNALLSVSVLTMALICCFTHCDNRVKHCSLFHVPSKKFILAGTPKYEWADRLERIILNSRGDRHIIDLYKRDAVKLCEEHFDKNDIDWSELNADVCYLRY